MKADHGERNERNERGEPAEADGRIAVSHDDGGLDPAIVAVLLRLRDAAVEARGAPWSLAKLGKRAHVPMSTLRRTLTQLDAAGLTATVLRDDGTGRAMLTAQGLEVCDALFGDAAAARGDA
ncbi:DNA-binding protein [Burkholderia mayonis]|uniref:DNA-binding protein n=1 Tax=Burkholderia mayonis TaxID=1385591 RepID=A0A1B4FWW8_9BURK|nr:DNA-binding protein [Burkholderia mayonis]AOJ08136.1 DNA-binding protein [Burkholderia mayonis]KVE46028.1 DNA-binding protein [Burkholderia mayonis]